MGRVDGSGGVPGPLADRTIFQGDKTKPGDKSNLTSFHDAMPGATRLEPVLSHYGSLNHG
jgi:hypothetical protein